MIRLCIAVILSGLLLLSACNPKPEVEKQEVEEEKTFTILDRPEKMFEFDNVFEKASWISAVNQLARYYDAEITRNELPDIGIRYLDGQYSVMDVLDIYQAKGFAVYPQYASYADIETAVLAGKPVFSQFNMIGNNMLKVIFYGYSDDELLMMDLTTGKERAVDRKRLSAVDVYDAFIPYKASEMIDEELESSVRYLEMVFSDAYYGNDGERLRNYLNIIEEKQLEGEVYAYTYKKCYYYTFFDRQLDIVEPLLTEEMETFVTPPHLEIALIIANTNQDESKMKSILSQLQVLPFYQDETLKLIIGKGTQFGFLDKVEQAEEMLQQRLDREI